MTAPSQLSPILAPRFAPLTSTHQHRHVSINHPSKSTPPGQGSNPGLARCPDCGCPGPGFVIIRLLLEANARPLDRTTRWTFKHL